MAKYALVVGIDRYNHCNNLRSAAKDAEAIAHLLEQHHYHVTRLPKKRVGDRQWIISPDKSLPCAELNQELKTFFEERAKHQEVILYFAGHGLRVSDALTDDENGYLVASDTILTGLTCRMGTSKLFAHLC